MTKGTVPAGALAVSIGAHALAVLLLFTVSSPQVDAGTGPMVVEVSLVGEASDTGDEGVTAEGGADEGETDGRAADESGLDGAISAEPAASPVPTTAPPPEVATLSPPPVKPEPARVAETIPTEPRPEPKTSEPTTSEPASVAAPRQMAAMVADRVGRPARDDAKAGGSGARGQGTRDPAAGGQVASGQGGESRSARYALGSALCPAPVYPRMARLRGQEGRVVLRVSVAADGRVTAVDVLASSGYSLLDRAAARTVAGWRLDPARRAGVSVPTTETISIRFDLTTS